MDCFWKDCNGNEYAKEQVTDSHLMNIIRLAYKTAEGKTTNKHLFLEREKIKKLLDEAIKRKLIDEDYYKEVLQSVSIAYEERMDAWEAFEDEMIWRDLVW